jgi:hypothetical protein
VPEADYSTVGHPLIQGLIVFVAAVIQDIFWAKYTVNAARHNAFMAATWGGLIPIAGAIAVIAYVQSGWYLIPYVLGSWVGTYYAVDHEHGKVTDR